MCPSITRNTWDTRPHRRDRWAHTEPVRSIELPVGSGVNFPIGGFEEGRTVRSFADEDGMGFKQRSSTGDRSKIHPSANMTRRGLEFTFFYFLCGIGSEAWLGPMTHEYSSRFRIGSSPSPHLWLFRTEIRSNSSPSTLSRPPVARLAIL